MFVRLRTSHVSFTLLIVILSILLLSASAAQPKPRLPPPQRSSTAALPPTAARPVTSLPAPPLPPFSTHSTTHPPSPASTSTTHTPYAPTSSTSFPPPPPPASYSSSLRPASPAYFTSGMPLSRMLGLVFVALLFVVLVISFVWYFWRRQWAAQRAMESQRALSEDGWLHVDERGQVVRDGRGHQVVQPYQPSMLSYMAASPTPAALTIAYHPQADMSSERQYVRF